MIWKLFEEEQDGHFGVPHKALTGHNHFVSDLALSQENCFAISSSWDKTLRLWDLRTGTTYKRFVGHQSEVFSVAFSPDHRQILSAGAEREVKLWNILAECKFSSAEKENHSDWVSCVRYSPIMKSANKVQPFAPYFASVGWDGRLKVWNTNFQIRYSFKAHESNVNHLSISPNGKYLATGGKDKKLFIWDILNLTYPSREFDAGSTINQIAFNPKLQWVAVGTDQGVKIFNLMNQSKAPVCTIEAEPITKVEGSKGKNPQCTSLTWNALGKKLFAGFTDGVIRTFSFETSAN